MENMNFLFGFFEISTKLEISDIIDSVLLIGAVISGTLTLGQWRHNLRLQQSTSLENLIEKFRSDDDLVEIIYRIDKGERWYNKEFHTGQKLERQVDKFMTYLSYLCYLKARGIIKRKEFDFIKYNIDRTLRDKSTQDYLFNLFHYSKREGTSFPFLLLLKYAKGKGFIKDDFEDERNSEFLHIMIP